MRDHHNDTGGPNETDSPYRPSALRVLRKSVADAWLHLAPLAGANVAWVVLAGLPVGVLGRLSASPALLACAAAATVLTVAAGTAVLFRVTNRMAHGEVTFADLRTALTDLFAGSVVLLLVITVILCVGAFNVYFYFKIVSGPWWQIVGIVWGYVIIMFMIAMLYCYPLLAEQRPGPFHAIKRSILLCLDNPGFTSATAGAIALWTIVVLVPVVTALPVVIGLSAFALCFVHAGFATLVANNALLELLRKYETMEKAHDAGGGVPGDTGS